MTKKKKAGKKVKKPSVNKMVEAPKLASRADVPSMGMSGGGGHAMMGGGGNTVTGSGVNTVVRSGNPTMRKLRSGCMKMPGIKNIMRKPNIISIIIILVKKKYTKLI